MAHKRSAMDSLPFFLLLPPPHPPPPPPPPPPHPSLSPLHDHQRSSLFICDPPPPSLDPDVDIFPQKMFPIITSFHHFSSLSFSDFFVILLFFFPNLRNSCCLMLFFVFESAESFAENYPFLIFLLSSYVLLRASLVPAPRDITLQEN